MALFKIFKGNETSKLTDANATGYRVPTDGYAYYDTSSNLFYIDAAYGNDNTITREPINANISNIAMNGVFYGTCDTAAGTKAKVATLVNGDGFHLATGVMVVIKFTYASAASTMTLSVNGSTPKNLVQYGTTAMSSTTGTNGWPAEAVVPFVYNGASWVRFYWSNSTYYYTSAYSSTAAGTAAKSGTSSAAQTLTGSHYFQLQMLNTNTSKTALTLNMNSLGAKKIYINGGPSSTTNYELPRGCYLVYYDADGDNGNGCYHFRTDNKIAGNLAGNADTATYATTAGVANSVTWNNVSGAPTEATTTVSGLMSANDKVKLNGIETGAQVNQNAFSYVKVNDSLIAADAATDTVEFIGSNVTLTPDTTNDKLTIGITSANVTAALGYTPPQQDTTYTLATFSADGLMSSVDKAKLDGIATGAEVNQNAFATVGVLTNGSGTATNVVADAKSDTLTLAGSSTVTLTGDATNDKVTFSLTKANVTTALGYTPPTTNTTYDVATQSANGLMSSGDKTKLDGIATGAEVNQNAFSNVKVGNSTVAADAKTDTLELVGSNVTLTPDTTNDKITIGITSANVTSALGYTPPQQDTTYSNATTSAAGLMSADDKTKLNGIATGAEVNQNAFGKVAISGQTTVEADAKIDTLNLAGSNVTLTTNATSDTVTIGITSANVTAALGYTPPQQDTTYSVATQSAAGLMSAADKKKLDGVATSAEVNQNAFSNIKVGSTTVAADTKTDTVEFVGSNIGIAGDATNDKVTFSLTSANVTTALGYTPPQQDTTYSNATTSAAGLMSADDKTKLNGIATGAEVNQNAFGKVKVGSTTVEADAKIDTLELVGSNVTLTPDAANDKVTIGITSANVVAALGYTPPQQDTTYSNATTSAAGLMSSDDKTKLNGIATGAEVNQNAFSNIKVGSTTVAADAKTDTVEFVGSNVTITPDATNDKVTFSLTSSNVTTALGYTPPQQDTTYSAATQSATGLMSAADKKKLDGVATGAQVNVLESVTASGTAPLTLSAGTITNKSIAISGSIADATTNAKGVVKIGDGITVTDGTISVTAANLGLSNAMHYIGTSATAVTDGGNENPIISGYSTKTAGDVIIYGNNEYVYTANNKWELLGQDGSFKTVQTAVNSATDEITTATRFVHSITQDANGVITVKTRPLPTYNNYSLPTASTTTKGGIKVGSGLTMSSETLNHSNSVTAKTAAAQSAKTLTWGGTFTLYEEKYDTCGHITGVASYNMTMPSNPNTDIKQNITLATTSKAYLTGVTTAPTSTAQALTGVADTGVYLTATAGEISAVRHSFNVSGTEKAYMVFNSTTNAIDFIFN